MKKNDLKLVALGAALALGLGAASTVSAAAEQTVETATWAELAAAPQGLTFEYSSIAIAPIEGPDSTGIGTAPPDVSPGQP